MFRARRGCAMSRSARLVCAPKRSTVVGPPDTVSAITRCAVGCVTGLYRRRPCGRNPLLTPEFVSTSSRPPRPAGTACLYLQPPAVDYLVDEWEVAADVGAPEGAGVGDAAVAADADGDVVAAHHVEEVVEVVDGVPGVAPLVGR
ncbi:Os05g0406150 [Oryza sativa Japonica Group]|uniref:Os05g0406150 protein n=1 Tax=Oryza sativa subsp. japonica TaxID=39947 RepID=A0A0P0WM39_ORYSJ|nr:Os05g0406150 [Oryza sativa Japonica Group]